MFLKIHWSYDNFNVPRWHEYRSRKTFSIKSSSASTMFSRHYLYAVFVCLTSLNLLGLSVTNAISSLSSQRILSELRDVIKQNLSLNIPFNYSNEDCGVRLSPLRNNILEWHFTFLGMNESSVESGLCKSFV